MFPNKRKHKFLHFVYELRKLLIFIMNYLLIGNQIVIILKKKKEEKK